MLHPASPSLHTNAHSRDALTDKSSPSLAQGAVDSFSSPSFRKGSYWGKHWYLGKGPNKSQSKSTAPFSSLGCLRAPASQQLHSLQGKPDEFQLWLSLAGDRMDLTVVSLPAPRKKTALGSFSKVFLCYACCLFFSILKKPLAYPNF